LTISTGQKPKGWRKVKLGEIAKLSKESWKSDDENMPYIGLEHIKQQKLQLIGIGESSKVKSNKFLFKAGNTLFGKLRPYFRKVVKPKFHGICSTDIWVVLPEKEIDENYIFYFFANQELVDIATASSNGTRMPRANWNFLSTTIWNIPPILEQKAIAEVLSSLDDKIDLHTTRTKRLRIWHRCCLDSGLCATLPANSGKRFHLEILPYQN